MNQGQGRKVGKPNDVPAAFLLAAIWVSHIGDVLLKTTSSKGYVVVGVRCIKNLLLTPLTKFVKTVGGWQEAVLLQVNLLLGLWQGL